MSIYLDTLVVVNVYISWLTLSLTSRVAHIACSPKRKALAALLGGFSSLTIVIPCKNAALTALTLLLKVVFLMAVSASAFYKRGMSIKRIVTATAAFFVTNLLFGGGVYLLQAALKTDIIYINGFNFYFDISLAQLIFMTCAVYLAISIISFFVSNKLDRAHSYRVTVTVGENSYCMDGVCDTGNTVTDLFSGKNVVICTGFNDNASTCEKRITAVPYSTVNGEGVLYAFSPDSLYIEDEKGLKKQVNALVAFTEGGSKRAVFNPKVLA